jgi:hypothetical protein
LHDEYQTRLCKVVACSTPDNLFAITKTCKELWGESLDRLSTLFRQGTIFRENTFNLRLEDLAAARNLSQIHSPGYTRAFMALLGEKAVSKIRRIRLLLGVHKLHADVPGASPLDWKLLVSSAADLNFAIHSAIRGFTGKFTVTFNAMYHDAQAFGLVGFEIPLECNGLNREVVEALVNDNFATENRFLRAAYQRDDFSMRRYSELVQMLQLCRGPVSNLVTALRTGWDPDM